MNELDHTNLPKESPVWSDPEFKKAGGVFTPPAPRTKSAACDKLYVRGDNLRTCRAYISNNAVSRYIAA